MRVILDRRSCTCWQGSCECCFAGNLTTEYFSPACLLDEVDDGNQDLTVIILDRDGTEKTLVVTDENWGAIYDSWLLAWQGAQKARV